MRVYILAGVLAAAVGCASASHNLAVAEDTVHDHLANVNAEYAKVCGPQGVTPSVASYQAACTDVKPVLLETLTAGDNFNRCVATKQATCLTPLIETGGRLITELKKLPEGAVVVAIKEAVAVITAAVKAVGGGA